VLLPEEKCISVQEHKIFCRYKMNAMKNCTIFLTIAFILNIHNSLRFFLCRFLFFVGGGKHTNRVTFE
jgi:hypothetical protein